MPRLIHSLKDFPDVLRGGAVAIGNFDGVHRGHEQLVRELVAQAHNIAAHNIAAQTTPAIVFTFDPPPIAILSPMRAQSAPLTGIARRAELLHKLGVDLVVAYPTDMALLQLTAEEFFQLGLQLCFTLVMELVNRFQWSSINQQWDKTRLI